MRWRRRAERQPPPAPAGTDHAEATDARLRAGRMLEAELSRREEAREVADQLRELRARNHFGEALARAMRRREA